MAVTRDVRLMPRTRDWYTGCVAGALFPLHELLKGRNTAAARRRLEASQWWTRERLEALRLSRLRELLQHAYRHVPYYRPLLDAAGMPDGAITSLDELTRLPPLTKAAIRAHTDDLKSRQARRLTRFNTGGSSGEPLIFYMGPERVRQDVAAKWRATRWWGVDIGDPEIVVWGSPIELGSQDRIRALRDRMLRTQLLPAFEMSEARLAAFCGDIRAMRPRMLFGYPSSLALIAQYARAQGLAMDDLGVAVAFVTAERLYDEQRRLLEEVFGCAVANGYGGRDSGFIAHQCPAGGMHITAEDIIVETLDPDGNPVPAGTAGEVTVTHLATGDFPFIRYRTGDVAVLDDGACACGRGLPLLKEVQGRTTDFIVAADGTVMHGLALIYVLRDIPGIEAFKIVQERRDWVRVLLVPGEALGDGIDEQIRRGFAARLGEGVKIDVERVGHIAPERSGKYRYVVSKVAPG